MIKISGASQFQWTTTEKIYPFERALDGSTLYCKIVPMGHGSPPSKVVAHGISGLVPTKVYRLFGRGDSGDAGAAFPIPFSDHNLSEMNMYVQGANIILDMRDDFSAVDVTAFIIYSK